MSLYEEEKNGPKIDKRREMALKSKVIEDSEVDEDIDSDEEEMTMYARKFRRFIKKKKLWKRIEINQVEMNQRRNLRRISKRAPKRIVRSFVTTVTNLVMSNKTANFPRSIPST